MERWNVYVIIMEEIKNKIKLMTIQEYILLKETGMFWELYPEATGNYQKDRELSEKGKFKIEE